MAEDDDAVRALYFEMLKQWNQRNARAIAVLYGPQSLQVGFDGSQMIGAAEIESTLGQIFAHHATAAYIGKVRSVRLIAPDVALLHAVVGMLPPGKTEINPAVNAIQTLLAKKHDGQWRIELFHNTPAAYHGRPDDSAKLTEELQTVLRERDA